MRSSIVGVVLAAVLLAAAAGCGAKPAEGPGEIVYSVGVTRGTQHGGLFVTDEDGGNRRRLNRAPAPNAVDAKWSPAGDQILVEVDTLSGGEIWLMKPDGTGAREIAEGLAASWSRDGRQIAVVGTKGFISILSADGSPVTEIDLALGEDEHPELAPDWSPDGDELVLSVNGLKIFGSRLLAVGTDGETPPRALGKIREGTLEEHAVWSLDGKLIAFHSSDEEEGSSVWVMRADGTGRRSITGESGPPAWSTDGDSIISESYSADYEGTFAFSRSGINLGKIGPARSGLVESGGQFRHELDRPVSWHPSGKLVTYVDDAGRVIVSRPDGLAKKDLTDPGEDAMPEWSPDGSKIAFTRGGDGDAEVYVIGADGTGEQRIGPGSRPQWSPDGMSLLIDVTLDKRAGFAVVTLSPLRVGPKMAGDYAAWSPDGKSIAFVDHHMDGEGERSIPTRSTLNVLARGQELPRVVAETEPADVELVFDTPVWSPGGTSILIAEHDPISDANARLRRVNIDGNRGATIARDEDSTFNELTISPDGKTVAFLTNGAARIETIDLDDGKRRTVAEFDEGFLSGPAWSPDGNELAVIASPSEGVFDFYVMKADGKDRRRISKPPEPVSGFDWRPSG